MYFKNNVYSGHFLIQTPRGIKKNSNYRNFELSKNTLFYKIMYCTYVLYAEINLFHANTDCN